MRKLLLAGVLLNSPMLQAVNENAPRVHLSDVLRILAVILLIVFVKTVVIKYFSKFSWYASLKASTWLNLCSFVIGYPILAFMALFVLGPIRYSFNLSETANQFMFLPVTTLIGCLIEIPLFRYLYPQVDRKQSFKGLVIANILTSLIYTAASILL